MAGGEHFFTRAGSAFRGLTLSAATPSERRTREREREMGEERGEEREAGTTKTPEGEGGKTAPEGSGERSVTAPFALIVWFPYSLSLSPLYTSSIPTFSRTYLCPSPISTLSHPYSVSLCVPPPSPHSLPLRYLPSIPFPSPHRLSGSATVPPAVAVAALPCRASARATCALCPRARARPHAPGEAPAARTVFRRRTAAPAAGRAIGRMKMMMMTHIQRGRRMNFAKNEE